MIKEELIRAVAQHAKVTNVVAERVLNVFAEVTANNLSAGLDSPIPGVGKLTVVTREARMGRNPRTGEPVPVPKSNVVKFKPSSALRADVK
jgi:DNA-binding protein HU-beta